MQQIAEDEKLYLELEAARKAELAQMRKMFYLGLSVKRRSNKDAHGHVSDRAKAHIESILARPMSSSFTLWPTLGFSLNYGLGQQPLSTIKLTIRTNPPFIGARITGPHMQGTLWPMANGDIGLAMQYGFPGKKGLSKFYATLPITMQYKKHSGFFTELAHGLLGFFGETAEASPLVAITQSSTVVSGVEVGATAMVNREFSGETPKWVHAIRDSFRETRDAISDNPSLGMNAATLFAFNLSRRLNPPLPEVRASNAVLHTAAIENARVDSNDIGSVELVQLPLIPPKVDATLPGYPDQQGVADVPKTEFPVETQNWIKTEFSEVDLSTGRLMLNPLVYTPAPVLPGMWGLFKKKGSATDRPHAPDRDKGYNPAPEVLPGFPDAVPAKKKTVVQGGSSKRDRWKTPNGQILEWDQRHGYVEKYNKTGKIHLGSFDPTNGNMLRPEITTFITALKYFLNNILIYYAIISLNVQSVCTTSPKSKLPTRLINIGKNNKLHMISKYMIGLLRGVFIGSFLNIK